MFVFIDFEEDEANHMSFVIPDLNEEIYEAAMTTAVRARAHEIYHVLLLEGQPCLLKRPPHATLIYLPQAVAFFCVVSEQMLLQERRVNEPATTVFFGAFELFFPGVVDPDMTLKLCTRVE